MTAPSTRPTATPEDAARADGVLTAWGIAAHGGVAYVPMGTDPVKIGELRGLLISAFADARHDAYADAFADAKAASSDG